MATERGRFELVPIPHVDIYGAVLAQLSALVAQLQPGDRLPSERELSEQLAVSRVSLREALRSLEGVGRIQIRRNSGSFVLDPRVSPITARLASIEGATIEHLISVRAALEDRVVASLGGADHDWDAVEALLEATEAELALQHGESGSLDVRFEALLGRMTANPLLVELQHAVHELWVDAWGATGSAPGARRDFHREHREILSALRTGDVSGAQALMARHVDRAVEGR